MRPRRGINHHLLTSCADPLDPGENQKVLWMIVETQKRGGGGKKKSQRTSRFLSQGGVRGAFMSGQLIVSVGSFNGGIETNCLSAIQLRSSVPRDKRNKKKRKVEKRWRRSRITHKPVFTGSGARIGPKTTNPEPARALGVLYESDVY